jgi:hypothetical protein
LSRSWIAGAPAATAFRKQGRALLEITRPAGALLFVNDRLDVALAIGCGRGARGAGGEGSDLEPLGEQKLKNVADAVQCFGSRPDLACSRARANRILRA